MLFRSGILLLHYCQLASLVAQLVKNPPAMQETPVRFLGCPVACQAPLSMEFSRLEYWGGLSFPTPGHLFFSSGIFVV